MSSAAEEEDYYELLDDKHLFRLAGQVRERWEELLRAGLLQKEEAGNDPACLQESVVEECKKFAPNDNHLQAHHLLVHWRYKCWQNQCPKRKMLLTLGEALKKSGNSEAAQNFQSDIDTLFSIQYV
ncbi:hypothetical protein Ciccas_009950 [Cichlidogyrus casuarinus]|uniref:Uncharacterized protein n=1 Tax=Cichlidogyrus casuarinus TaxID=1844966 RepID=A0ABD2PVI0_9PLAT